MAFSPSLGFRALSFAAVVASALASSGCACTLVACRSQLTVEFDEPLPVDYFVTVTVDGVADAFHCTFDGESVQALNIAGSSVECGESQFAFIFPTDEEIEQIDVRLTLSHASVSASYHPEYDEVEPNGEWCGPTCYQSTVPLDVPAE